MCVREVTLFACLLVSVVGRSLAKSSKLLSGNDLPVWFVNKIIHVVEDVVLQVNDVCKSSNSNKHLDFELGAVAVASVAPVSLRVNVWVTLGAHHRGGGTGENHAFDCTRAKCCSQI